MGCAGYLPMIRLRKIVAVSRRRHHKPSFSARNANKKRAATLMTITEICLLFNAEQHDSVEFKSFAFMHRQNPYRLIIGELGQRLEKIWFLGHGFIDVGFDVLD